MITLLPKRAEHLLKMYEPRVILVLVQFELKSCPTSPHEDHQDWLCGYACQNEWSAIDIRHASKIEIRRRIRTRSYRYLTTSGFLIQAIMYERVSFRLYGSPATNIQWISRTSQRIRVWHEGEVAGVCGGMLSSTFGIVNVRYWMEILIA